MQFVTEVKIDFKSPPWKKYAAQLKAQIPGVLAATMQTQRAMIFDSEGKYNGRQGWKPLKCRDGQILKDTGTLSKSIGPMNTGITPGMATGSIVRYQKELVTIGTNIAYAHVQNEGATIVPVKAKALRYKCHGKWRFSKKSVIPARPFNDWTLADIAELSTTMENFIGAVLRGE